MDNFNYNNQSGQQKQIDAKVKKYISPEGITTSELERGLWYVEHKKQLRLALYGFLIVLGAVSWVYTIYGFAYYLVKGMSEDELLAKQLVQTQSVSHDYVRQIAAKDLVIGPVEVIRSGDTKYDLFALVNNNNQKWWAEFNYYFLFSGGQTKKMAGYILPSEGKYLKVLAQDSDSTLSDASLVIENLIWHRLDQHQIADWSDYYSKHFDIQIADIKYTPASLSSLAEKVNLQQLSFRAVNRTAYNYWEVGFTIIFYSGGQVVNINHYVLSDFMSGQIRPVEISWAGDLVRSDKVEIIPEINIMKKDIYIPHQGEDQQSQGEAGREQ